MTSLFYFEIIPDELLELIIFSDKSGITYLKMFKIFDFERQKSHKTYNKSFSFDKIIKSYIARENKELYQNMSRVSKYFNISFIKMFNIILKYLMLNIFVDLSRWFIYNINNYIADVSINTYFYQDEKIYEVHRKMKIYKPKLFNIFRNLLFGKEYPLILEYYYNNKIKFISLYVKRQ